MFLDTALSRLVGWCARRRLLVICLSALLAVTACTLAAHRLGMTTSLAGLFDANLPWKQQETALKKAFPQFNDLIVAVIAARIPEEADATADALAKALGADPTHFASIRRPDTSPYLQQEGLLFLDPATLAEVLDKTVDAAPFLGQLAADPSARGLFGALGLIGEGVARGQADLGPFAAALNGFDATLGAAIAGHPAPLSWETLMASKLASLAGPSRIVLVQPHLDFHAVQPGGAATQALRTIAAKLEFVASGDASVHLTGLVPLEDDEFSSAAQGAVLGLALSFALVLLWLFLALQSWRLIIPVFLTLLLGLALTTGFAALAVGTLNLVSVAFAILFVGIAVDFSIQFSVRFREMRRLAPDTDAALSRTGHRVGRQLVVAGAAIAAGFLAFVPTSFRGVAELGLIAGIGMLFALACTLTFLPAALALLHPAGETAEIGFVGLAPADRVLARLRTPILAVFALLFLAGAGLVGKLSFDSNSLHTKPQDSEAMRTLMDLLKNPVTNPFTIDIVRPSVDEAAALAAPLAKLSLVDHVVGLQSFVPADQHAKLALIQDAASILAPVLAAPPAPARPDAAALRSAIDKTLAKLQEALPKLPADSPMRKIAADLAALRTAPDATLLAANESLVRFLPGMLGRLRLVLTAKPVTLADVPASIARDYVEPDGAARLQVVPTAAVGDSDVLRRFVAQVRTVAPDANGAAVNIIASADTIIGAFRTAAIGAILAIAVILLLLLRHPLDAALVLAPLLMSAALTVLVVVVCGITLNFANIIALPLLLGVGVSFNIYFVMNARAGETPLLVSATTRAVVFSALTTGSAFGSLALSAHPGTASMGTLLLISLACTLLSSLVFVPALLGRRPQERPGALPLDPAKDKSLEPLS
jgi:hopanoid biosynthesis associated RND transporter like protein HpnN